MNLVHRSLPKLQKKSVEAGFTLVEMIVAIALFAIVMLVSVGALLSLSAANKKAQALQSVMNNLNISLDSLVRNLRMGKDYHCGTSGGSYVGGGADDCIAGDTMMTFSCNTSVPSCMPGARWSYRLNAGGYIERSLQNGDVGTWHQITAPEVSVTLLKFYVTGTTKGDGVEPKVIVEIEGSAGGASARSNSTFHIQATAVQRELDL